MGQIHLVAAYLWQLFWLQQMSCLRPISKWTTASSTSISQLSFAHLDMDKTTLCYMYCILQQEGVVLPSRLTQEHKQFFYLYGFQPPKLQINLKILIYLTCFYEIVPINQKTFIT